MSAPVHKNIRALSYAGTRICILPFYMEFIFRYHTCILPSALVNLTEIESSLGIVLIYDDHGDFLIRQNKHTCHISIFILDSDRGIFVYQLIICRSIVLSGSYIRLTSIVEDNDIKAAEVLKDLRILLIGKFRIVGQTADKLPSCICKTLNAYRGKRLKYFGNLKRNGCAASQECLREYFQEYFRECSPVLNCYCWKCCYLPPRRSLRRKKSVPRR